MKDQWVTAGLRLSRTTGAWFLFGLVAWIVAAEILGPNIKNDTAMTAMAITLLIGILYLVVSVAMFSLGIAQRQHDLCAMVLAAIVALLISAMLPSYLAARSEVLHARRLGTTTEPR